MRLASILLLMAFLLVCGAAQSQDSSSRLDSVQVTGSARFGSVQLAPATGLQVGSQITRDDLQKAANTLAQLGPFSTVNYRFSSGDAGVRVEYQVTDGTEIAVSFDNFPGFTEDELKAGIKSAGVLFDGQAPEHGAVLDDMSDALARLVAARGMNFPVSHSVIIEPSGDKVQQFHIEGGAIKIASIDFSDALAQSDRRIHARLADIVGQPFSRSAVDLFEFEQVRPSISRTRFSKSASIRRKRNSRMAQWRSPLISSRARRLRGAAPLGPETRRSACSIWIRRFRCTRAMPPTA
jgi:outer membrane protein assembly factor BamA